MIRTSLRLDLRRSRLLTVWLLVIVVLYAGFIAYFYPVVRDNTSAVDGYLKLLPKGMLAAFGLTGSLSDPGVFYASYVGSFLWPLIAAIAGIGLATRLGSDAERGFLDLPLATGISRTAYLAAATVDQLVVLAVLAAGTVLGFLGAGWIAGAGFDAPPFLLTLPQTFVFGAAIAGVTTFVTAATLSRGMAAGIVGGVLVAMYLVQIIAQLQPDLDGIAAISVFHYLRLGAAIDARAIELGSVGLLSGIAVAGYALAFVAFRRRDLAA